MLIVPCLSLWAVACETSRDLSSSFFVLGLLWAVVLFMGMVWCIVVFVTHESFASVCSLLQYACWRGNLSPLRKLLCLSQLSPGPLVCLYSSNPLERDISDNSHKKGVQSWGGSLPCLHLHLIPHKAENVHPPLLSLVPALHLLLLMLLYLISILLKQCSVLPTRVTGSQAPLG